MTETVCVDVHTPSPEVITQAKAMLIADIAALEINIGLLTKQRDEKKRLLEKWEKSGDRTADGRAGQQAITR
jgi:hypothetical protein